MSTRKADIIAAALGCISAEGIQATTMKKIAKVVGITEPALYRHYASKEEILSALVDRLAERRKAIFAEASAATAAASAVPRAAAASAALKAAAAAPAGVGSAETAAAASAPAAIRAFFSAQTRLLQDEPEMTAILFSEDVFQNYPALSGRIMEMMDDSRIWLRNELSRGSAHGEFRKPLDAESASFLLLGGFRLLVAQWRMGGRAFSLPEQGGRFVDSSLALLLKTHHSVDR